MQYNDSIRNDFKIVLTIEISSKVYGGWQFVTAVPNTIKQLKRKAMWIDANHVWLIHMMMMNNVINYSKNNIIGKYVK